MHNTREKLIELLDEASEKLKELCGGLNDHNGNGVRTDHLIANGVTVQKWISVKDRLPENDAYINVTTDGVVIPAYWHNDRFYAFTAIGVATVGGVTHWMPLPEPPKGE